MGECGLAEYLSAYDISNNIKPGTYNHIEISNSAIVAMFNIFQWNYFINQSSVFGAFNVTRGENLTNWPCTAAWLPAVQLQTEACSCFYNIVIPAFRFGHNK